MNRLKKISESWTSEGKNVQVWDNDSFIGKGKITKKENEPSGSGTSIFQVTLEDGRVLDNLSVNNLHPN